MNIKNVKSKNNLYQYFSVYGFPIICKKSDKPPPNLIPMLTALKKQLKKLEQTY